MCGERIWVSRVVAAGPFEDRTGPFAAALLTLGWPPVVSVGGVALLRGTEARPTFLLSMVLTGVLVGALPALIRYYGEYLLPGFFESAAAIVTEPERLPGLAERYAELFARRYWVVTAVWTLLLLSVFAGSGAAFARNGIGGATDPAYWLLFALFLWGGLLTGIGFHGIVVTTLVVRKLTTDFEIDIDPYHPDRVAGLSVVGHIAIRTTLLVSVGALMIPFAAELAIGGALEALVGTAVAVYVVFIAASFLYPTWLIYRSAQTTRRARVNELRTEIERLTEAVSVDGSSDVDDVAAQLEISRLQRRHRAYLETNLYPMSTGIFTQLVGSVLLPVVTFGIQLLFETDLVG